MKRMTAATVALLLAAACSDDPAPPFAIEGSGSVEGLLFFDANEDGIYDPSAGDTPLEDVRVVARKRGSSETLAGGVTTTDATGRFTLAGLPGGTHDLYFDEATIPEGVSICQNPVPTTVYLDETRFEDVAGRPACLSTLTEAKKLGLGAFAIVRGIVTSSPGQIRGSYTIIEDEETGLRIFDSALEGLGIEVGDLIEVAGTIDENGNEFQLESVELREHIEDAANPTPLPSTTSAIAAIGTTPLAPLVGRLVRISGAELTRGFTTGGSRNGLIDDGSGATEMRIEAGLSSQSGDAEIRSALGLEIGACYDIVGVVGLFGSSGQLFPRSAADITEVACN